MVRKHFALSAFPFDVTPQPDALFASAALGEAEARLTHLLELRAVGLVTGEAGSGKTMPIPPKLDSHSSANWTPDPPQTGRLFQRKLDSRSEATHGVDAVYALRVTSVNVGLSRHW